MNQEDVTRIAAQATTIIPALPGYLHHAMVGSAVYMPEPADVDFVVLVDSASATTYCQTLEGWKLCGDYDTEDDVWAAVRSCEVEGLNLMVTTDRQWFERYELAVRLSDALNLQTKAERIIACRVIRDGCTADEARLQARLWMQTHGGGQ